MEIQLNIEGQALYSYNFDFKNSDLLRLAEVDGIKKTAKTNPAADVMIVLKRNLPWRI